jgi:hypothetical protein
MRRRQGAICVAAVLLIAGPAAAQEAGRVGVAMGYPATVGVLWHVTSRVAIEPEIAISKTRVESRIDTSIVIGTTVISSGTIAATTDTWTTSPGVSLRIYMGRWDDVSAYVAPGYVYHHNASTSTTTAPGGFGGVARVETRELSSTTHDMRGMFGVQYAPHRKFTVFGEVGVRYASADLPTVTTSGGGLGSASSVGTSKAFGNAGAVGVVFYF